MIKKQFITTMIVDEETIATKNTSYLGNNDSVEEYINRTKKCYFSNRYHDVDNREQSLEEWAEWIESKELTNDDTRDIAIRCVDKFFKRMVGRELGTGDDEFTLQDIIHDEINKALKIEGDE